MTEIFRFFRIIFTSLKLKNLEIIYKKSYPFLMLKTLC